MCFSLNWIMCFFVEGKSFRSDMRRSDELAFLEACIIESFELWKQWGRKVTSYINALWCASGSVESSPRHGHHMELFPLFPSGDKRDVLLHKFFEESCVNIVSIPATVRDATAHDKLEATDSSRATGSWKIFRTPKKICEKFSNWN